MPVSHDLSKFSKALEAAKDKADEVRTTLTSLVTEEDKARTLDFVNRMFDIKGMSMAVLVTKTSGIPNDNGKAGAGVATIGPNGHYGSPALISFCYILGKVIGEHIAHQPMEEIPGLLEFLVPECEKAFTGQIKKALLDKLDQETIEKITKGE